jgi:hypothetical protein
MSSTVRSAPWRFEQRVLQHQAGQPDLWMDLIASKTPIDVKNSLSKTRSVARSVGSGVWSLRRLEAVEPQRVSIDDGHET